MTVKEILSLSQQDISRLKERDIRKITGQLRDAANKKLKRLEKSGIRSRAYRSVESSGGKFSTKGKTRNELIKELKRAKKFYTAKTATATGAREQAAKTSEALKKHGIDVTPEEVIQIDELIDRLNELDPSYNFNLGSPTIVENAKQLIRERSNLTVDELAIELEKKLEGIYEEQERANDSFDADVSTLF